MPPIRTTERSSSVRGDVARLAHLPPQLEHVEALGGMAHENTPKTALCPRPLQSKVSGWWDDDTLPGVMCTYRGQPNGPASARPVARDGPSCRAPRGHAIYMAR